MALHSNCVPSPISAPHSTRCLTLIGCHCQVTRGEGRGGVESTRGHRYIDGKTHWLPKRPLAAMKLRPLGGMGSMLSLCVWVGGCVRGGVHLFEIAAAISVVPCSCPLSNSWTRVNQSFLVDVQCHHETHTVTLTLKLLPAPPYQQALLTSSRFSWQTSLRTGSVALTELVEKPFVCFCLCRPKHRRRHFQSSQQALERRYACPPQPSSRHCIGIQTTGAFEI